MADAPRTFSNISSGIASRETTQNQTTQHSIAAPTTKSPITSATPPIWEMNTMPTTPTAKGTKNTTKVRIEIHNALSIRRNPFRSAWRQLMGCPRYELMMIPKSVVIASAPTKSPMTRLMASPPSTVDVSVGVVKVELPTEVVVTDDCSDTTTSASIMPAGMAMINMALAMDRKFRPQILKVASIRSPTPSGRSTRCGGTHMTQAAWSVGTLADRANAPPLIRSPDSCLSPCPRLALRVTKLACSRWHDRSRSDIGPSGRRPSSAGTYSLQTSAWCP